MWLPHARGGVSPRRWFLILLSALALCGEHVSGQREKDSFYKWRDREASDKRLLDMQVQALTKGEPKLFEESPKDEEFVRIAKSNNRAGHGSY
jgi:hypothetical protein